MIVPRVRKVYFEEDWMVFEGENFKTKMPLQKVSRKLLLANETDRLVYSFSPSGYTISWNSLGISLSVSGLLAKWGSPELVEQMMKKKES